MNRRIGWKSGATAILIALGLATALFAVFKSDNPAAAPTRPGCLIGGERPCSPDAEFGKAYRFQVLHCGLRWIVDFDQSYWDVDAQSMTETEDGRFGINSDEGTMTLTSRDVAVYRSFKGGDATLHRKTGKLEPALCG
jgi:hypothetical protein